jgi:glycosyltransferase involved in cell wall biosynthesis/GT2 family glycosyltransferase
MATYNGAATLPKVLDAYCSLSAPAEGWRLVIVDNGSDDDTGAVIDRYAVRLPMRCLSEPRRGKNVALNTALTTVLNEDGSDFLIFTDDDATPARDWLLRWSEAAAAHPDYAIFGGSIAPDWVHPPPQWIIRLVPLGLTFGLTSPTLPEGPVFPGLVWGANMALRRTVFDSGHRFDTSIGPNGGAYAMGSETELTRRLFDAGHRARFCPQARVSHHIRAHQLQTDHILRRAWRYGRGKFRQDTARMFPELLGVPRWMLKQYLLELGGAVGALLQAVLTRQPDSLFLRRWELAYLCGYFHEAWFGGRRGAGKLVLITSYSGELGGMELRMAQEARFLAGAGHRGALALRRFPGFGCWAQGLRAERMDVSVFDPPRFIEQWSWRHLNRWRAAWLGTRQLRRYRADLVHVAFCWTDYGASALWLAYRCRLPAVISVHNAFPTADFGAWQRGWLLEAFSAVRGVYAVSKSAMQHFLAIYLPYIPISAKLTVIPNCVDTARFQPSPCVAAATRLRYGVPAGSLVLGSVGRLSEQKRPGEIIGLLARLRQEFSNLYLLLVGVGPLDAALRDQVSAAGLAPYVIFAGFVADVERIFPALDVHLLLSRNEGFGIATIEAMACGVPTVATDVPGSADILRDSQAGLLVTLDSAAAAVAALLRDPRRRHEMGRVARAVAIARYANEVVAAQVQAFYRGLI